MNLTAEDRKALQDAMNVLAEILQQASPEVPERIDQWPEDDTHLRGEFWKDKDGDIYRFSDGHWDAWQPATRQWWEVVLGPGRLGNLWAPYTRTTDPSVPRTWDTLDDVPEGVERVTGDYAGRLEELARSPLSESGWFQRAENGFLGGWTELSADRTKYVTNIKEDQ